MLPVLSLGVTDPVHEIGTIRIERVFGPEIKTGPYKHPAAIAELQNGDLYIAYYGGEGEYAVDTGVFGARRRKGSSRWSQPVRIAHDPFRSLGNPVVWQAPDGLVWLFYVVRWGDTWSTSRIQGKISQDGARTWSDSFVVSDAEGMMVRGKPIVLSTGDYLLPVYHETGFDTEKVGADSTSRFLRWDPKAREWRPSGIIRSTKGNIQPAIAEVEPGRVVAFCRRGGGYEPVTDGYIVRSESGDGGRTWSEGKDSDLPNPNAAVDLLRLRNGHLALIYNDSMNERTPLTVAISTDGGTTWPFRRNIMEAKGDFAYPYAIQTADGRVHVVFTTDERTVIRHAVFDEEWVRAGASPERR
ncbi:MAG: exo-alpha-sialidase [Chthonomonadales bacterium]|nr:exo-alpha-sialidase [Chthonomonadales bacterium]